MPSAFESDHEADMADPVYATEYRKWADVKAERQARDNCRQGCPTRDHHDWGDCARAARIQIDREALKSHD